MITRPDLIPKEYIEELQVLQENVPPFEIGQVKRLIELEMKMFISDGFFHADLHPGNIFFTAEGKIILIDFGMYGELEDEHRDHFILYWLAAVHKQTRRAFQHLIAQTKRVTGADEEGYYRRFKQLAEAFYESDLSEMTVTQVYLEIITNGIKYGFVFPSDLVLHAKAITTAEALAFNLVPNLKFKKVQADYHPRICQTNG